MASYNWSKLFTNRTTGPSPKYGESKLIAARRQFRLYQCLVDGFHNWHTLGNEARDKPAELLLVDDQIRTPYQEDWAYKYCSLDEVQTTVLFGLDQYIQLSPGTPKLLPLQYFLDVQAHFAVRGFDFLIEEKPTQWFTQWQQYAQPKSNTGQSRTAGTRVIGFDPGSKNGSHSTYNLYRYTTQEWQQP